MSKKQFLTCVHSDVYRSAVASSVASANSDDILCSCCKAPEDVFRGWCADSYVFQNRSSIGIYQI